jgi:glycogen operon protein
MTDSDWQAGWTRSVVAYLDGTRDADRDEMGRLVLDDDLLLVVNGWWERLTFTLPDIGAQRKWIREIDTSVVGGVAGKAAAGLAPGDRLDVAPRSLVLLSAKPARRARSGSKPATS